jgi:hypothetical protein
MRVKRSLSELQDPHKSYKILPDFPERKQTIKCHLFSMKETFGKTSGFSWSLMFLVKYPDPRKNFVDLQKQLQINFDEIWRLHTKHIDDPQMSANFLRA